ncbi:helix-turn-helix domain-containing protein [Streptomyces sp. gb14]|uniref:helix-turn-helix domain-containing protein n=1 Tax=Streptomyces sp. gb14 TaxID=1827753 RepID=UPI000BF2123A|nr:helix-turn-helix domain-containing protein [Streptomyces sp. gb14]
MKTKPVTKASLYGGALKAASQSVCDGRDVTQGQLAKKANLDESTVSRYLNGKSVAPERFVDILAVFVSDHGHPLSSEAHAELHRLRKNAQEAQTPRAKLRRAEEEIEQLTEQLAAFEETARASQDAEIQRIMEETRVDTARRVAELEADLEGINEEIRKELAQEKQLRQALETERDQLRLELRDKNKLLADAGELVRSMNADLERKEEEAERREDELQQLRREVKALRGQLARLREEKTVPGESMELKSVVATQSAGHTATASPRTGTAPASRSAPQKKPGTRPSQVPAPRPQTPVTPAPQDKRRVRLIWPLEPLFATISMLASVGAPLLILLNCAAFAAACGSKNRPSLTGLVLLAVAGFLFTLIGYVTLMVIAGMTDGLTGDHRPLTLKIHRWALLASLPALALGIHLLVTTRVTNTGLWWLHHFGITT